MTPDIIVLGKALGGGALPIAAVLARADLDVAGDFAIGHYTHEKNPVTARAALTTLDIIEDEGLTDRAARLGTAAMDRLRDTPRPTGLRPRHPGPRSDVRRRDRSDRAARTRTAPSASSMPASPQGLSFKISAGTVLTLSPPLTIPEADLDRALSIVEAAVRDAA